MKKEQGILIFFGALLVSTIIACWLVVLAPVDTIQWSAEKIEICYQSHGAYLRIGNSAVCVQTVDIP